MSDYCLETFRQEIGVNFQNNFSCMFNVGHVCANLAQKGYRFGRWIEDKGDVQTKIKDTLFFLFERKRIKSRYPFASNFGVVR